MKRRWDPTTTHWSRHPPRRTGPYVIASTQQLADTTGPNPFYDHVSEDFLPFQEHRANSTSRKGQTRHGTQHYAVHSRIRAGVPLSLIDEEMGHSDSAFTLAHYGHVIAEGLGLGCFE